MTLNRQNLVGAFCIKFRLKVLHVIVRSASLQPKHVEALKPIVQIVRNKIVSQITFADTAMYFLLSVKPNRVKY